MAVSEVVSSVWRPCLFSCKLKALFKRNEAISSCLLEEILTIFFLATLAALARVFSDLHFERGEGPGDEVELGQHGD